LSSNGVNYSFRKHEVGDETARDGCQVRLVNDIYIPLKIHLALAPQHGIPCCGALAAGHCGTRALLQEIQVLCREQDQDFRLAFDQKQNSKESTKKLNKVLKKGKK
jgi:hypothetical protein